MVEAAEVMLGMHYWMQILEKVLGGYNSSSFALITKLMFLSERERGFPIVFSVRGKNPRNFIFCSRDLG